MATAGKIQTTCACGKVFTGDAILAGMSGTCPACGARATFPGERLTPPGGRATAAGTGDDERGVLRGLLYVVVAASVLWVPVSVFGAAKAGTTPSPTALYVFVVALAGLAASCKSVR